MDALQIEPREEGLSMTFQPDMATLYKKMAKVMGRIAPVRKDGKNDYHGYDYQTAEAIANAVRNILAEEGIAFFASMISVTQEERQDSKGKPITLSKATFDFTFACGETGATITHRWTAESLNNSDKGINQVATAATKYFLMKTFLISTPEEADTDSHSYERPARTTHGNRSAASTNNTGSKAKSNGSTKPQLNIAEWRAASRFMFDDDTSHQAVIDFLLESHTVKPDDSLNAAMAITLTTQASRKYEWKLDKILEVLNSLGRGTFTTYGEAITGGITHREAWEAITTFNTLGTQSRSKNGSGSNGKKPAFGEVVKANGSSKIDLSKAPDDAPAEENNPK